MRVIVALSVVALAAACGPVDVEIPFQAAVGETTWECGQTYEGIGTTETTLTPKDFRLYLHDIQINGEPVTLADNDFQANGVVLLDFEDNSGDCGSGDARLNTSIVGTAPEATGDITFKLGVPFDQNHQDVEVAAAPLNEPSLFWNWNGGYKFVRVDTATTGLDAFNFHLGSTGCEADDDGVVTSCANENREQFTFTLDEGDAITFDINELLQDSDLDTNTDETPPGCLAAPTDPECESILNNLSNFAVVR